MGNKDTEQYYLERRLFGDDYVEALFDESEREEGKGCIQSISEVCAGSYRKDQETEQIKRIHFKGRGKNGEASNIPTCPHCQQDLKRSYIYKWNPETKKGKYLANGWECEKDKYKIWD